MREARKTAAILLGVGALLMLVVAVTVPMIVATAPAVFALILGLGAFAVWPRRTASPPTE